MEGGLYSESLLKEKYGFNPPSEAETRIWKGNRLQIENGVARIILTGTMEQICFAEKVLNALFQVLVNAILAPTTNAGGQRKIHITPFIGTAEEVACAETMVSKLIQSSSILGSGPVDQFLGPRNPGPRLRPGPMSYFDGWARFGPPFVPRDFSYRPHHVRL